MRKKCFQKHIFNFLTNNEKIAKKQQTTELAAFSVLTQSRLGGYTKILNRQAPTGDNQGKSRAFQNKAHPIGPESRLFEHRQATKKISIEKVYSRFDRIKMAASSFGASRLLTTKPLIIHL